MKKEYCLITSTGEVVNMCMKYGSEPPFVTEFQESRGYQWVPVEKVSQAKLNSYYFYTHRP